MDHEPGDPPPNPQPRPHPVEAHREGVMPVAVPATHDPPEETWHDAPEEPLAGPPTHPDRLEGHPHPFPPPRFPDGGRYVQNEVYRAQAAALEESDIPLPAPSPRRLADAVVAVVALSVLAGIIILIKVFIWDRSGDAGWVYVVVVFFRVTVLVGGLPRLLREGGQVFSALAWPIWAVPPSPDFLEWATPLALPVLTSLVVRAGIWAPCKDAWNVHQYLPARTRENIRALLQAWWEFCKGSLQLSFGTAEAHKLVRSPGQYIILVIATALWAVVELDRGPCFMAIMFRSWGLALLSACFGAFIFKNWHGLWKDTEPGAIANGILYSLVLWLTWRIPREAICNDPKCW